MTAEAEQSGVAPDQRPTVLLAGFFTGLASVFLTMGVYWPFAPLFPALVAGVAALIPADGHYRFAKGALIAVLAVVVFEVLFGALLLLGSLLR
ncbi:Uncharacterised protein [Mycolicibacterium aurum]|uniref:Uncharacterized protein n=1 Tax=Mycolicibacterium aurum TaxID=1791 RepID=A0A448IGZ3_MYCAU|nr:hypothetical protein [Mycolicibacterium aurum]VEG51773.1 Uncharacterised protein [Mycolicibacterium aurum]